MNEIEFILLNFGLILLKIIKEITILLYKEGSFSFVLYLNILIIVKINYL